MESPSNVGAVSSSSGGSGGGASRPNTRKLGSGLAGNPQVERIRDNFSGQMHGSIDDDELKEIDPQEHNEELGSGIPPHLAQQTGPKYVSPQLQSSLEEDSATDWIHPDDILDVVAELAEGSSEGLATSTDMSTHDHESGATEAAAIEAGKKADDELIPHPERSSHPFAPSSVPLEAEKRKT